MEQIEYKAVTLFFLGLLGILIHVFMKIQDVNRKSNGDFKFGPFVKLEWPSIMISVCVVSAFIIVKHEIKFIDQLSGKMGVTAIGLGYMANSVVYFFKGKAEKLLNDENVKKEN